MKLSIVGVGAWASGAPGARIPLLLLAAALLATAVVAVGTFRVYGRWDPDRACCDHLFYRSMAYNFFTVTRPDLNEPPTGNDLWAEYGPNSGNPYLRIENGLNRQPPFAYRPLAPLLAGAIAHLPLVPSINHAFYLLTFVSLAGAAAITGLTVFHLTKRLLPALAGIFGFVSLPWAAGANLHDYMLTDPLAFLCLAAAVYFMATGNGRAFFAAALVGVFVKEIVAAVLVAYLVRQALERRLRTSDVMVSAAIVASYLGFRFLLPVPDNAYGWRTAFLGIPSVPELTVWSYATFFGLGITALVRFWTVPLARSLTPLALGAVVAALFASNHERALIYAFPFVLIVVLGRGSRGGTTATALELAPALTLPAFVGLRYFGNLPIVIDMALATATAAAIEISFLLRGRIR